MVKRSMSVIGGKADIADALTNVRLRAEIERLTRENETIIA